MNIDNERDRGRERVFLHTSYLPSSYLLVHSEFIELINISGPNHSSNLRNQLKLEQNRGRGSFCHWYSQSEQHESVAKHRILVCPSLPSLLCPIGPAVQL